MLHVVEPCAVVVTAINEHVLALTCLLSIDEVSIIPIAVKKRDLASAINLVSFELALISGPVRPNQYAVALLYFGAFDPMSSVFIAAIENKFRSPFSFVGLFVW